MGDDKTTCFHEKPVYPYRRETATRWVARTASLDGAWCLRWIIPEMTPGDDEEVVGVMMRLLPAFQEHLREACDAAKSTLSSDFSPVLIELIEVEPGINGRNRLSFTGTLNFGATEKHREQLDTMWSAALQKLSELGYDVFQEAPEEW